MQEREQPPQSPESMLREAKQRLREKLLDIDLFNVLLHSKLHANEVVTVEPYFKSKDNIRQYAEAGIYLKAQDTIRSERSNLITFIEHERFLPIITNAKEGFQEGEVDQTLFEESYKCGFSDQQVQEAVASFKEIVVSAIDFLPIEHLILDNKTFTWKIKS